MNFRTATSDDYKIVAKLFYQIFEKHLLARPDIYHDGIPLSKELYGQLLAKKNEFILLCTIDETVVGMCHYKLMNIAESSIMNSRSVLYIEDFCVEKSSTRKGFGTALYQAVVEHAKELKVDCVELNVWVVNKEAEAFYKKIGLHPKSTKMEYIFK